MSEKIYGRPVTTPMNPKKIVPDDIVKTVNGISPDENGNVEVSGGFGGGFVASDTPPEDTSLLWVDTSDNNSDYNLDIPTDDHINALIDAALDEFEVPSMDLSGYAKAEDIPTDEHINALIDTALGVIENGTY